MRLALRRGATARDREEAARPKAVFAGILDGRSLWVALPTQAGRLALRRVDTDDLLHLPTEEVTDQPDYLAARIDLADLDAVEARYDVVLVPTGRDDAAGTEPVEVWTPPIAPTAHRPSADGRTQHVLVRTPDEALRIRTTVLPAAAGVLAVRKIGEAVEITLDDAGAEFAILDDDAQTLVSWPVNDGGVVTITRDSVAHLAPLTRPAMTGQPGAWQPVRRRANDLIDPRAAAPLPQIDHPHADRPRLRLPWSRDALLQVRIFAVDETDRS